MANGGHTSLVISIALHQSSSLSVRHCLMMSLACATLLAGLAFAARGELPRLMLSAG